MQKRQKDLKVMAEAAGLSPLEFVRRRNRVAIMCEAPNGVTREFTISNGSSSDYHGDANEQAKMKRFARENPSQAAEPDQQPTQQKEDRMPRTTAAPAPSTMAEQLAKVNIAAAASTQVLDLSPVEFFRLCRWQSNQDLARVSSIDGLVLLASQHMGKPVEESTVRNAMAELDQKDPDHWGEPTDPQAIIVRELGLLMQSLGHTPTPAWLKLHAKLLP